jgi:carboxylesterase type B
VSTRLISNIVDVDELNSTPLTFFVTAGLFHRAISQSGTALNAWAWPGDALFLARRQAAYAGCDPDDDTAGIVECLRKVDGETLINSGDNFKVRSYFEAQETNACIWISVTDILNTDI